MGWVKLEDRYATHPKIMQAGEAAMALDICGMCYCREHSTDGFIPEAALTALGPVRNPRKAVAALEAVGRWEWDANLVGWWVHDFGAYNPDAETDRAAEEARRVKAKKAAAARWGKRDAPSNAPSMGVSNARAMPPSLPSLITSSSEQTLGAVDKLSQAKIKHLVEQGRHGPQSWTG